MTARDIILKTKDVAAGYGGGDIISNISVDVEEGRIFTVIGPNGSGKSTFIKVLAGLLRPRVGGITIRDEQIALLAAPERVAKGVAYVPQEYNVFPNLTINENLLLSTEFLKRDRRATSEQAPTATPARVTRPASSHSIAAATMTMEITR